MRTLLICVLALVCPLTVLASTHGARKITPVADGVYVIEHADATDDFPNGNTTVIIGREGVFVVDAAYLPSAAREDIAQIRKWTDKPVRYLLNTHWHYDHNDGNDEYVKAFPGVQIVSTTATRDVYLLNGPGWAARATRAAQQVVTAYTKRLADGKDEKGQPLTEAARADLQWALASRENEIREFATMKFVPPTLTFDRELVLHDGREIRVQWLGNANTEGDAVVYLPAERVLVTGDIVVAPVPYSFGGYPTSWANVLDQLSRYDAAVIVPGHGGVQHDMKYIHQVRALALDVVKQVRAASVLTFGADEVGKQVDLREWKRRFAADDPTLGELFDESIAKGMVHAAYLEFRKPR